MQQFFDQFIKSFIAIFLITDSLGNLPFFMGLTESMSSSERRKTFNVSLITGFVLLLVFLIAGTAVLELFKLTMNDLKIAGGILLLLIAIEIMIKGRMDVEHKEDVGVVPLGSPLLVGPGAITTSMVLLAMYGYAVVVSAIVACFLLMWVILFFSEHIYRFLGRNGALILTKIMGILIAAIAVQFIREGVLNLIR